jgi:hypothetical protein
MGPGGGRGTDTAFTYPWASASPASHDMVERFITAVRNDFGCLVIIVAFVVIMISTIVFANIITPPSNNPFV